MGGILKHWRVISAAVFSALLVVGSYLIVRNVESPSRAQASTEEDLLKAIAAKDSDNDGLPDWEESLYGTDPKNSDTRRLGMTDGEAVQKGLIVPEALARITNATSTTAMKYVDPDLPPAPAEGSLTATFAQNFFTRYLSALKTSADGSLSEAELKKIANDSLAELAAGVVKSPEYKTARDIVISGAGSDALRDYAITAENAFVAQKSTAKKSEIYYLKDLVESGDVDAATQLASIAKTYRVTAASFAALTVPQEMAQNHLRLVNALAKVGSLVDDFARVNNDPLVTMLALQQYPNAVLELGGSFIGIANVYKSAGVTIPAGQSGARFVNLMANIAAKQKAAQRP